MTSLSGAATANVLVVGAGAIGTMAAYALEKGGLAKVTAVVRSSYEVVSARGYNIKSINHGDIKSWKPYKVINEVVPMSSCENHSFDFIVVATKNIADVPPSVAEIIHPAVTPGKTAILLLQNGLNIERPLIEAFPTNPILSGITVMGARESPRGTIEQSNKDISYIGAFKNPNICTETAAAAAHEFVRLYSACPDVVCAYDPDVALSRWRKLLYNASYNSVAALLRTDTSRLRASEYLVDDLVAPAMAEVRAIARAAADVALPAELAARIITAYPYAAFFQPSMCQDAEKGRLLEFENIVGEPLREAERVGVAAPTLRVLYALLRGVQYQVKEAMGLVTVPKESNEAMKYGDRKEGW